MRWLYFPAGDLLYREIVQLECTLERKLSFRQDPDALAVFPNWVQILRGIAELECTLERKLSFKQDLDALLVFPSWGQILQGNCSIRMHFGKEAVVQAGFGCAGSIS